MPQVTLSHVTKHFEGPVILDDVSLDIEKGRKIGVIGRNGCGKSTLLRMIAGEMMPSSGEIVRQRGLRVSYQAQELAVTNDSTVRQEMRKVFADSFRRSDRLLEISERLANAAGTSSERELLAEYSRLVALQEAAGDFTVDQRISSVLTGLGLPETAWDQPLRVFSGGERNVIGLARILSSDPDVILLDEPSNHLDMDGLEWFIRWVRSSPATILMVSHDRHLLDACVDEIWEVERGRVTCWTGAYAEFQQQKSEAMALQERQYKNQQRVIARIEFQARRLKDMAKAYDDPGQARRAKAMLHRLEQMEKVERPVVDEKIFHSRIDAGQRHGHLALGIYDFHCGYGDRTLFEGANLEITFGQRVALVGPNGCGKSTLHKHILAEGSWSNPKIRLGASVRLGDYNQFHEDVMDAGSTLLDWIQQVTGLLLTPASDLLHRFLFTRDDLTREIGTLSGGEKSRLQLARLTHEKVNFLLLDEPTNHLDILAAEQIERMLEDYEGSLLVISHDRYFLEKIVDVVVEVRDRRLHRFQGSFAEWWQTRKHDVASRAEGSLQLQSRKSSGDDERPISDARLEREEKKAEKRERKKLENRLTKVERAVAEAEEQAARLTACLEQAYAPGGDLVEGARLAAELKSCREALDTLIAEWEDVASQVDRES